MGKGKYTVRSIIVRCIVIMIGVAITGFGAAAYVKAVLGADPVTSFVQGIGIQLNLDFGMAMNIFNIVFFVIILILNRKLINIGTVLYVFTLGTFCNIFIDLLSGVMGPDPTLVIRIVILVLGTLALGVGLGFYQAAELGCGPSDAFNQTMAKITKIPLKWERMIFDAIMVVGGFIMGGNIMVGTILGVVGVGPVMGPIIGKMGPIVDKWAGTVRESAPAA